MSLSLNLGFHISIVMYVVHDIKNYNLLLNPENDKYILHGHTADCFDL